MLDERKKDLSWNVSDGYGRRCRVAASTSSRAHGPARRAKKAERTTALSQYSSDTADSSNNCGEYQEKKARR